jgi:uncharacterized membrane protein
VTDEMSDDDWIMLRAPAQVWEWIGLPIFYLVLIGFGGYLAVKLTPHPIPVIGAIALIITSVLSVVAAVVVGVFSYRSYALATPDAARRLFKAMNPLQWCFAGNVLVLVLLTGVWIALVFPVGLILFARLSLPRSRRN